MKKTVKRDYIFSVRFSYDVVKVLRRVAHYNDRSVGSVIRGVVRSYFVSKGLISSEIPF